MSSNSTATVKYHQKAEIPFVHLTETDIQHPGLSGISVTRHLSDHLLYCTSGHLFLWSPLDLPIAKLRLPSSKPTFLSLVFVHLTTPAILILNPHH